MFPATESTNVKLIIQGDGMSVSSAAPAIEEGVARRIEILKALANPIRFRIAQLLCERRCTVTALVDATGLAQSRVSRELGVLREKRIVQGAREGHCVCYCLMDPEAIQVLHCLRDTKQP